MAKGSCSTMRSDGSPLEFAMCRLISSAIRWSVTLTSTDYGVDFTSSIEKDNVMACQFHPEKSQKTGLQVLKNFSRLR